jgi:hypothetical protein
MLKIHDWVEITPQSDLRWSSWVSSRDTYDCFRSKIGVIENICKDYERDGQYLYSVKVDFPNGLNNLGAGQYYEWFRDYHLILSSKSRAALQSNMAQAGKELQEWEALKKKKTHEMLKKIFCQPEEKVQPFQNKHTDPNQWDLKAPIDNTDTNYDTYYDYFTYSGSYSNATNMDQYYYMDLLGDDDDKKT